MTTPDLEGWTSIPDRTDQQQQQQKESASASASASSTNHRREEEEAAEEEGRHIVASSSNISVRSSISQRSSNSQRSSGGRSRSSSIYRSNVVFVTESQYSVWTWILLALPIILVIFQMVIILMSKKKDDDDEDGLDDDYDDDEENGNERHGIHDYRMWGMGWVLILILGLYMMILPKQIDVRTNGSVGIKTFLMTYQFTGACRAYVAGPGREDFVRPRLRFATDMNQRVVVRRKNGMWDLVLSPTDADAFVNALDRIITNLEKLEDDDVDNLSSNHFISPSKKGYNQQLEQQQQEQQQKQGTKPDLSSV